MPSATPAARMTARNPPATRRRRHARGHHQRPLRRRPAPRQLRGRTRREPRDGDRERPEPREALRPRSAQGRPTAQPQPHRAMSQPLACQAPAQEPDRTRTPRSGTCVPRQAQMRATSKQPHDRGDGHERTEQRAHGVATSGSSRRNTSTMRQKRSRLLEICVMARALEDDEPRVGDHAFHHAAIVDGCFRVLLAPDEQHRDVPRAAAACGRSSLTRRTSVPRIVRVAAR